SQVGAVAFDKFNLAGSGTPLRVAAGLVSASFFPMMGVQPAFGRAFEARDDNWSAAGVAILGYRLWQDRFHGALAVHRASIRLDDQPCTIIGIMPPGVPQLPSTYEAGGDVDLWLPLERAQDPETMHWRFSYYVSVFARLKPGVAVATAQREVDRM